MQTRSPVTLSWPRLIGVASGIFGAALTAAFAAQLSVSNSVRVVQGPAGFIPVICGCVFLFLAFPLFTGRAWARRALVLATYCTLAALAISFSLMVFHRSRLPSTSYSGLSLVIGACALVGVLTVLFHFRRAKISSSSAQRNQFSIFQTNQHYGTHSNSI